MSYVIWKFQLDPDHDGRCTVTMPRIRLQYLSVGEQHGRIVLWAVVDPSVGTEERRFFILGTGWAVPPEAQFYRGTVQMPNGLVWHVMEAA